MARICYFTGKKTRTWNTRSHSMRATRRTYKINLIDKRVFLEDWTRVKIKINSRLYKKMKGFM